MIAVFQNLLLFAELNKQNGQNASSALCGIAADRKHLNYEVCHRTLWPAATPS